MKLMRHHCLAISVTLSICVWVGEISISQASEYAQDHPATDRYSRSVDNVWRSGMTFNDVRRLRYERKGTSDNPWQPRNNWRFEQPRSREQGWGNRPAQADAYERRERYQDGRSRSYNHRPHYEAVRYQEKYRDNYRDINNYSHVPYAGADPFSGHEFDSIYDAPLMPSSMHPGLLYGAYPYGSYSNGRYPYPGMGLMPTGFSPW